MRFARFIPETPPAGLSPRRAGHPFGRRPGRAALQSLAALLLTLVTPGCGDGVAEPIFAGAVAPAVEPTPADTTDGRVSGLCGPCPNQGSCGDDNDLCLVQRRTEEGFCARDCDEGRGCPQGYECMPPRENGIPQCVPENFDCPYTDEQDTPPPLAELRAHMLEDLNRFRVEGGRAPFAADSCLDDLAQAATSALALFDEYSFPYQDSCDWAFETRGVVARYDLRWRDAATALWRDPSISSKPRDADRDFLSGEWTRVGIGILLASDEAFIALSYGR